MKKYKSILLLGLHLACMRLEARALRGPQSIVRDSVAHDSIVNKRSVVIGINHGSDAIFFGRTSPTKFPYYSTDFLYNSKTGFFVYGSVWHIQNASPYLNEVDLGAGYLYRLTNWLSGNISYTHFVTARTINIIKLRSLNDIELKNTASLGFIKTSLTVDYLFGESSDIFLTGAVSHKFELLQGLFDRKDYVSFTPSLSVIYGTQNFVQAYTNKHMLAAAQDEAEESREEMHNSEFTPLNYSLRLPVSYNRPHYTLEASYKYSVPVNVEKTLMNQRESFFYLRLYYLFY